MGRIARVSLVVAVLSVAVLSVNTLRAGGDSPLAQAVKTGDLGAVHALIKSRADVDARSGDGSTPLLWATHTSDVEIARALIAAGADVNAANHYGVTPLLDASRTGDATMMAVLLKAGATPGKAHPQGETPLMAAARAGSVPGVKLLLEQKVDLNAAESVEQTTALMFAAAEGHVDVVDVLLKAGADPNRQAHVTSLSERTGNSDHPTGGFTALMWAARNGEEAVVRRLAAGGANLNLKNGDHASATMIAIYNDRFDMAATLIGLGADVNDGSLYVAVEMRESTTDQFAFDGSRLRPNHPNTRTALDLIQLLLEKGADPNKNFSGQFHSSSMPNTDRFDNTPFYRAAITADVEALKLLVAHGANLEQTPVAAAAPSGDGAPAPGGRGRGNPNAGRTAAMVAIGGGRGPQMTGGPGYIRSGAVPYREPGSRKPEDAFAVLIKAGANPNAKGADGTPLLHQVAQTGNLAMIRTLAEAHVDFTQTNRDGLTALDVAEGKQPAGGAAAGAGRRGAGPPAGGGGGRGARGGRGGARQDVAKLLRELMGLPPAPEAPAASAPAVNAPAAPAADADKDATADSGDAQ
jgi:ankyrin repeat protein